MDYNTSIKEQFRQAYEKDKEKYITAKWLVSWALQDTWQGKHPPTLPSDYYSYHGVDDLTKWFNWIESLDTIKLDYFPDDTILPLVKISKEHDARVVKDLSLDFDMAKYEGVGRYNAQDYLFQNLYPVPERMRVNRVLDFGAGYGRQANLWTQMRSGITFVGMDGLEQQYCMQNLYYQSFGLPLHDYVIEGENFEIKNRPGIYHLPTWRRDLLPKSSFDMVICCWVLPEVDEELATEMINTFQLILKPGGALYIRDHDERWKKQVFKTNLNEYLTKNGFTLEFRAHTIDREDLHGTPRIWRKTDPRTQREV